MKYLICFSLMLCYILFIKDLNAVFTKENCFTCCWGLPVNTTFCVHSCNMKFMSSQNYNSRSHCSRSCVVGLFACQAPCIEDCEQRYPPDVPGVKPMQRRDRENRERREARIAAGILTELRDPAGSKRKHEHKRKKHKKNDDEGTSGT